jgi:hypothetical protein
VLEFAGMGDAVSTLGFPIIISLILIKMNNEQSGAHREDIKEMHERHEEMNCQFRQEINALHKAIEKNTITMVRLVENLDNGGENRNGE